MYQDESQRFSRADYAQLDAQRRRAEASRKDAAIQRKGAEEMNRDVMRWQNMEASRAEHENYLARQRETGNGARRNQPGAPINIMTQEFDGTSKGQVAKYKEDLQHYRHEARLQKLYTKRNTLTHNVITGELKGPTFTPPARPVAPWEK